MRPRREVFALDYIGDTLAFFLEVYRARSKEASESEEMRWARDVLSEYFTIVGDHEKIRPLKREFEQALSQSRPVSSGQPSKPYPRKSGVRSGVSYEDFYKLSMQRRSVRWYKEIPVPREEIEKAVLAARQSPSACNRQPFFMHVFDDPELVPKVAGLPGGTAGFAHNFPVIVAVIGELRNYYGERDKHLIYVDASLFAMSFMYAAETLGLSTCCINWPDIETYELLADRTLKLEGDQRPVFFLSVGYADDEGGVPFSQKKSVEELVRYNWE